MLERQVEARDPEAVRLAFALYSVMDGAAMEDLDIMLGKLIRIDAALFLRELSRRSDRTKYLEGLLGNQGEELVDRIRAKCLETKLRITALERVSDSDLRQLRDECLHLLRNDLGHCE